MYYYITLHVIFLKEHRDFSVLIAKMPSVLFSVSTEDNGVFTSPHFVILPGVKANKIKLQSIRLLYLVNGMSLV